MPIASSSSSSSSSQCFGAFSLSLSLQNGGGVGVGVALARSATVLTDPATWKILCLSLPRGRHVEDSKLPRGLIMTRREFRWRTSSLSRDDDRCM